MTPRTQAISSWIAVVLVLLGVSWANVETPEWNFDVVPYVSIVHGMEQDDARAVHEATYASVGEAVSKDRLKRLQNTSPYRRSLRDHPENLVAQSRLFGNKVGYVGAVAAVHALGVNAAWATVWVSVGCVGLLGLGLRAWLGTVVPSWFATVVASCLVLCPPVRLAGKASSPDALSALLLVPALWLCTRPRWMPAGLLLVAAAISVRPDVVILLPLLVAWMLWRRPAGLHLWWALAAAGVGVAVYGAISLATEGFSYLVFLRHALVKTIYEVGQPTPPITMAEYFTAWQRVFTTGYSRYPTVLPLFALISAVAAWLGRDTPSFRPWRDLMGVCWAYVVLHILLFPVIADRYFLPQMVFCAMALVVALPARGPGPDPHRPWLRG
ncbi:MAG: hypothetical protein KTR31_32295 [Myxococcales bacterium]|nr:hypothetical protein [Myxococcales bacterium]